MDQFKYVAKGEVWEEVFDFVPTLTPRMIDKAYETVQASLRTGNIALDKVTGYFCATPPHDVMQKLVTEPLKKETERRKSGRLPSRFELDKRELKSLVDKEKTDLLTKIEGLREELAGRGLDKLVVPYPENVSTEDELFQAFYGEFGVNRTTL